jgi:replicative DNA helicase Mcm
MSNAEIVDKFESFLHDYYRDEIGTLAQNYPNEQQSLYIGAKDLYTFDPDLLNDWQKKPEKMQSNAESALARYDIPIDIDLSGAHVRLTDREGYLTENSVTDLSKADIGKYVAVSGHLSRITGKSPRLDIGVFECQRCGTETRVSQRRVEVVEPHECNGCERQGPFQIDDDASEWIDHRKIKLEEPIEERSQARGQSIPVYVEDDLCEYAPGDSTLPDHAGEHATVLARVRVDESQLTGRNASPETELWLDANAIAFEGDDESDIDIEAHRETFEEYAARDDAVDLVASSIAPTLHSSDDGDLQTIRRAAAAWLFNAYRADPDGMGAKRGDMHMCVIGDPGVGKSTLFKYLADVAPQSEFRTGSGLTEAGLTSAAVQEEFAGTTE